MTSFEQASYLTQVRRIRQLAVAAVKQYPIKVRAFDFIKYSANAMFKVTDIHGKSYLLRVHPLGYHTRQAILEELKWLRHISHTTDLVVPKVIATINGRYLVEGKHASIPTPRFCDMFEWIPGRTRWKSINRQYAHRIGALTAQLHKSGQGVTIKHRCYWTADGLVGTDKATFYNVEKLSNVSRKEQDMIAQVRRLVYRILKKYEQSHKDRTGLIHADTQPNNIIVYKGNYAIIDFDDCGLGFYGDDLACALFAFEYLTEGEKKKSFVELKEALFEGYAEHMPFTHGDVNMSSYFLLARKLVTIAWLELRKDNPKLRPYFREAVIRAIKFYKNLRKDQRPSNAE